MGTIKFHDFRREVFPYTPSRCMCYQAGVLLVMCANVGAYKLTWLVSLFAIEFGLGGALIAPSKYLSIRISALANGILVRVCRVLCWIKWIDRVAICWRPCLANS